jgi:hypothetical protein
MIIVRRRLLDDSAERSPNLACVPSERWGACTVWADVLIGELRFEHGDDQFRYLTGGRWHLVSSIGN